MTTIPKLLIGGTLLYELQWNDCYKKGFRQFSNVFFFQEGNQDQRTGDVIYYKPGINAFQRILKLLPTGWTPEYVLIMISEFHDIPEGIETSPYTTVSFWGDRASRALKIGQDIPFFDVYVPDSSETLPIAQAWGAQHGVVLDTWNPTVFDSFTDLKLERDIDVIYTGTLDRSHILRDYRQRDKIVQLVANLQDRYRVLLTSHLVAQYLFNCPKLDNGQRTGLQYIHALNRTRIGLSIIEVPVLHNMALEIMANGALAFIPDKNFTTKKIFKDRVEAVFYNSSNLLELLEYYLEHEDERAEIARRGYEKVHREFNFYKHVLPAIKPALDAAGLQYTRHRPMARASKAEVLITRGRSYFYNGQLPLAWHRFQEVQSQTSPFQAEAANNMAVILLTTASEDPSHQATQERIKMAFQLLEQAQSLAPDNTIVKFNHLLTRIHYQPETTIADLASDGWLKSAAFTLNKANQDGLIFGAKPYSHLNLELSYARVQHYQLGDSYRRRVCELLTWYTWMQVGEQYLKRNDKESALEAFLISLPFNPDDYHILSKIGEIYLLLDKPTEAIPYLTHALDTRPFAKNETRWLAQAYLLTGQKQELVSLYHHIVDLNPLNSNKEKAWFENMLPREAIQ